MVQAGRDARQVAYAVAIAVSKRAGVDLVDGAVFPPGGAGACEGVHGCLLAGRENNAGDDEHKGQRVVQLGCFTQEYG